MGIGRYLKMIFFALAIGALISSPIDAAESIKLDADHISFEEGSGKAIAEGNVSIYNGDLRLYAPYVEYDSANGTFSAESDPTGGVTLLTKAGRLTGERVEYDIMTRHGSITRPNGKADAFYVRGDQLKIMPLSEAPIPKRRRGRLKVQDEDSMAAMWQGARITTCNDPMPHYRFEAKSITVLQGDSIVISKPKVYLGDKQIFSYPFDYLIPIGGEKNSRHRQFIFPRAGYESKKGAGLGVGGGYGWGSGYMSMEVIGWTEGIWEGRVSATQDVFDGLYLFADLDRKYDKDRDETKLRPRWGAEYSKDGWHARLQWSQRELVTVEKRAGSDSRYEVWKEPEFEIMTPWIDDAATGGKFRFLGSWGRYEDASQGEARVMRRWGLGAQLYGDLKSNSAKFRPYYNAVYWHYGYDSTVSDRQQILSAVVGAKWSLGRFDMDTAYLRRWTKGDSPMGWDDQEDAETIYQEAAFIIPTRKKETNWRISARAAYDLDRSDLAEMVYKVGFDQHCMLWEAVYRDDRTTDNDDWFGLNLSIKAYPDSSARLGGKDIFDPFKAPNELLALEDSSMKN